MDKKRNKKKTETDTNFNKAVIGEKIRLIRLKQNLTMDELAEKSNITSNYLSRIELGKGIPRLPVLVDIANALGVGTDYILDENLNINKANNTNANDSINELLPKLNLKQKEIITAIMESYFNN